MKNYTITVNGNVYDVTVEETGSTPSTASTPRRAAAPAAAAPKAAAPAGAGSIKVEAGAAGKVFKLEAKVGDAVKKGDTLLILEPQDGTVASIDVAVGDSVESGALLATLN